MLRYDRQTKPGLVALYNIRPGNRAGPFLQPGARMGCSWVHVGEGHQASHQPSDASTPIMAVTSSSDRPLVYCPHLPAQDLGNEDEHSPIITWLSEGWETGGRLFTESKRQNKNIIIIIITRSMYWRRVNSRQPSKRWQAPGDATVQKCFSRDNFVTFRRRSKRIAFL